MATEPPTSAPAVVAVVVTCDSGPWFHEVLASVAAQDYPNLSVLVIDAGGREDPTPVVASVLPGAFVRRLDGPVGFGTAANEVLEIVEGASHFLFCHDDVALAPDAIRLMVEEAFRSNAGIASPKYVQWDDPTRLLAVGATTDKVAVRRSQVDPGELDQEQHDAVREVLVAPSGATLVRADLFSALGGFDRVVDGDGEDIDLCWRARLYGARVIVVPAARVRHLEAAANDAVAGRAGRRPAADPAMRDRNRYRTLLTCYRLHTLAWILPLAVFWAAGEAVTLAVQGRFAEARLVLAALAGSTRRWAALRKSRRKVQRHRHISDRELRSLQVRGNARLRGFIQSRVDDVRTGLAHQGMAGRPSSLAVGGPEPDADGRAVAPPDPDGALQRSRRNVNGLLLVSLLVVFVVGTRTLFGKGLPELTTLPDTSGGLGSIWSAWWSAWQTSGLGVAAPASPALGLLALLGTVLFGAVGTLEHVVVLGPLLVGPIGAWRAARPWSSRRGQAVAAVAYAVVPLPYNALSAGHWGGLVAYAVTPWVLSLLVRLSGAVPLPAVRPSRAHGRMIGLALLVAAVASVAPSYLYVVPVIGLGLVAGSALAGRPAAGLRTLGLAVAASVAALLLLLPWSVTAVASRAAVVGVDPGPAGRLGLGHVLRFATGPYGTGAWQWLLLLAAALPLFIGRQWRLEWAARLWVVALTLFALAWAGRRGWLPPLPVEVVLAPAAAALAGSTALGAAAFELDLPGYNFGWRQGAAGLAGICLAAASVPWLIAAAGGRWDMPSADASTVIALPPAQKGDYRVLWVGDPDALPLAGRQLAPGMAYGTSFDGEPDLADHLATGPAGAAPVVATDLRLVEGRLTTEVGHLLAPAGIKYLIVPNHAGPSGSGGRPVPVPAALLSGLGLQTDLQALPVSDPDYTVYENAAWAPVRAVLPADVGPAALTAATGGDAVRALERTDLAGSTPVLVGGSSHSVSGRVPTGVTVYVGSTRSAGWDLTAGGHSARGRPAFGWATAFNVPASAAPSARAHLGYSAPLLTRAGYLLQIVLWVGAVAVVVLDRRRRQRAGWAEEPDPAWFVPMARPVTTRRRPPGSGPGHRPLRQRPPGPGQPPGGRAAGARPAVSSEPDGDEVWTDV